MNLNTQGSDQLHKERQSDIILSTMVHSEAEVLSPPGDCQAIIVAGPPHRNVLQAEDSVVLVIVEYTQLTQVCN